MNTGKWQSCAMPSSSAADYEFLKMKSYNLLTVFSSLRTLFLLSDSGIRWIWRFTPTVNWSYVRYCIIRSTYLYIRMECCSPFAMYQQIRIIIQQIERAQLNTFGYSMKVCEHINWMRTANIEPIYTCGQSICSMTIEWLRLCTSKHLQIYIFCETVSRVAIHVMLFVRQICVEFAALIK